MSVPHLTIAICSHSRGHHYISLPDLSPAGSLIREQQQKTTVPSESHDETSSSDEDDDCPPTRGERSEFEVELTSDLLSAFATSLSERKISLRFFAGSWASLASSSTSFLNRQDEAGRPQFHIVLTSETIYRTQSLPSLLSVLHLATSGSSTELSNQEDQVLCLVAAKVVYFGVGGGINEFVQALASVDPAIGGVLGQKGEVETVWEQTRGVARKIMRVRWSEGVA